jgi:hypothetical protein
VPDLICGDQSGLYGVSAFAWRARISHPSAST